jgi:uncharacterized protein
MATDPTQHASKIIAEMLERGHFSDAYAYSLPLAEQGEVDAQLYVGWMLHTGKGVTKNLREAEEWYRRAIAANSVRAEFNLGSLFWNSRDFPRALEWFERAGADGFGPALYHLGRMYRHGVGVAASPAKAREYVERAARLGHIYARRDLALEMVTGARGISQIPRGFLRLCGVVWLGYKTAYRDIWDDALLRL